jgi:hypothetical protein
MKTLFKHDIFIDFAGKSRQFSVCAVDLDTNIIGLGISVQNPRDLPNIDLGKVVAKGKAQKRPAAIINIQGLTINHHLVLSLIDAFIFEFKNHPENFIAGYSKDRILYLKNPTAYLAKFK